MARFITEPTPNPNSLKVYRDAGGFLESGLESFASAAEAKGHELGERLFGVEGVVNVFILPHFLTVSKAPSIGWEDVWPRVEEVLEAYFDREGPV